jgi:predicted nucleic acid-binding protein
MATYLLDTNILIDILRGRQKRRELAESLLDQDHLLAICPINVAEIYAGMRPKEEPATTGLVESLQLLPISGRAARQAGLFRRGYAAKGVSLSLPDALIAAVAIEHGCTVVTENRKDFPMPELSLYPL